MFVKYGVDDPPPDEHLVQIGEPSTMSRTASRLGCLQPLGHCRLQSGAAKSLHACRGQQTVESAIMEEAAGYLRVSCHGLGALGPAYSPNSSEGIFLVGKFPFCWRYSSIV